MAQLASFTFLETVLVTSFSGLLNVAALVGNVLVCLAIYRKRKLRTTNNLYITALSLLGILFACFVGPSIIVTYITGRWIFGSIYCGIQVFLIHYVEFAMLHTIALTAFNRYCRMVQPTLYKKLFQKKKRSALILGSVLLFQAVFFGAFSLPVVSRYRFSYERASCSVTYHSSLTDKVYVVLKVSLYFVLTCIIVLFCYFKVFRAIRDHQSNLMLQTQHKRTSANAAVINNRALQVNVREIRVTKTLLAVVLVFLLCWIPEYIISIFLRINPDILPPAAKRSLLLVPFICCASNPIVYAAVNRNFLVEFRDIMFCRWRRGSIRATRVAHAQVNVEDLEKRSNVDLEMQPVNIS